MVFGEPDQWLALLIESRLLVGRGEAAHSEELRLRAFEEAPASSGSIDGRPFEWIADADSRLGPVLEAIINGRYYWVPFARLSEVTTRGAGGPARPGVDAGAPAVRERRRVGGADSDALPGLARRRPTARIALARKTAWERLPTTPTTASASASSRPTPAKLRSSRFARITIDTGRRCQRPTAQARTMADQLTPQERLQPALLDRLTDDEPDKKLEPREQRVMSKRAPARGRAARSGVAVQHDAARGRAWIAATLPVRAALGDQLRPAGAVRADRVDARSAGPRARHPPGDPRLRAAHPAGVAAGARARDRRPRPPQRHRRRDLAASSGRSRVPLELLVRTEIDLETGQVEIADLAPTRVA